MFIFKSIINGHCAILKKEYINIDCRASNSLVLGLVSYDNSLYYFESLGYESVEVTISVNYCIFCYKLLAELCKEYLRGLTNT